MKYKHLLLLIVAVNATALFSGIMEPDGALYAYIAKQIAQHNDFINLYNNGDWLDKPHFPFWIIAVSFKLLGITAFAYKLPAFLFWLTGIYYLYQLGKAMYNKRTAMLAVIIYATSLQAAIGLFDVRAEHYLTALTIASIYYLYKLYVTGKFRYVLLAALFSAGAIMTKGPFFLITIGSGLAVLIFIKKEWKQFINYRWYLYLLLTFIFILPELYCLYVQFDIHPEKIVYGKTNVSGLRFFFWDSQFGRFFNTGPIKGQGDLLFFFHTLLWTFLPWSILFYTAIIRLIREKKSICNQAQWIIIGSLAITFLIFSLSKFQLPYYVIIFFPQCALISADYLVSKEQSKGIYSFMLIQRLLFVISMLMLESIAVIFHIPQYGMVIFFAGIFTAFIFYRTRENNTSSIMQLGAGFFIITQLFLNIFFYPNLLQYQSGEAAALWFNKTIKAPEIGLYRTEDFSLKFYINSKVIKTDTLPLKSNNNTSIEYYFGTKKNMDSVVEKGLSVTPLKTFTNFHISELNAAFLYSNTRLSQLDTTVIFKLNQ